MRYVLLVLIGVLIGAFTAIAALNALQRGNAFPHGVMAVLAHHTGQIREQVASGQCDVAKAEPHLLTLRAMADDLETAFLPTGMDDAQFVRYSEGMRAAIDHALLEPATDCTILSEHLGKIGGGCQACHRDFK